MKWTEAQQAVIDSGNQSLLVTAAAGSGKTAVLVERIIEKITASDDPWDIDELLVVTFTKAAAKEMKERIYRALNDKITENPSDHRLRRMREKVFSSDIRTIDSYCRTVVSEYFSVIGLDPDFRFMDSGETGLLKRQVVEEMMRDEYETGREDFLLLSDMFSSKGNDEKLSGIILLLYDKAQAHAWPQKFYASLDDSICEQNDKSIEESPWMQSLCDWVRDFARESLESARKLLREAEVENDNGIFDTIVDNLASDVRFFTMLAEAADYDTILSLSDSYSFDTVGRSKCRGATEDQKCLADGWKKRRDEYKDFFTKKLVAGFINKPLDQIADEENRKIPALKEIVRLASEFDQRFLEEKKDRKSFEFSDIEHFAVRILLNDDGSPTDAAMNYRKKYREVMVDEYQDTNNLNEMILSAVTRDHSNYFMVGDVKQSIYGFRNADPGIILRKSSEYVRDESALHRRIDLDCNFRSRQCVTDTVNDIFRIVMIPEIGGVEYDKAAELRFGADYYPALPEGQDNSTETVILTRDDDELQEISDEKMALEATWTAQRIRQLMQGFQVSDGNGGMRPVHYSDIAIILRSTKVNAAKIMEVFSSYGIPAENAADTGYFSAPEVAATLNVLRIIDNPRQDIPLTSVLTSMYCGFSDDDLALIRTAHANVPFHEAVLLEKDKPEAELSDVKRKKLDEFFSELAKLSEAAYDTPVYELLYELFSDTGYDLYVSCLPGGERRRQNLMKLIDKAVSFSQSSFSGITSFISYIERIEKYKADEGEADAGNGGDAVQIMTIHKSKGLEFPVVFALGLGNRFLNDSDQVEISGSDDISMPLFDVEKHTKTDTLHFAMLRSDKADAELGENLRVLYVALTRAKEKLILVGCLTKKDTDSLMEKGRNLKGRMTYSSLKGAGSFYKVMIPALVSNGYTIQIPAADDFVEEEASQELKRNEIRESLMAAGNDVIRDRALHLYERFTHPYTYEKDTIPKQKYSVSEIKQRAIDEEIRENAQDLFAPQPASEEEPTVPQFLKEETKDKKAGGAERGTAMHRFLEKLDFSQTPLADNLDEQITEEILKGFLTEDQETLLDRRRLKTFLESDLSDRMQRAFMRGDLYREQAFVMGDTPEVLSGDLTGISDAPEQEQIIVQGIIDAFFVENGTIVLLDYKTDFVRSEEELIAKYSRQLQLYQLAVERAMDMKVSEMYLYSFVLGKQIRCALIGEKDEQ